ncbi:hypothetical protein ACOMHN_041722 [Nucella lapillus]
MKKTRRLLAPVNTRIEAVPSGSELNKKDGSNKLAGKKVFLDISDERRARIVELKLRKLKAKVENFLSNSKVENFLSDSVSYVVSSSRGVKSYQSKGKAPAPPRSVSPAISSTPSPFHCTPTAGGGPTPSPTYITADGRVAALTRGQQIVQMACANTRNRSPSPSGAVATAIKLKIKVIFIDEAEKWLDRELKKHGLTITEEASPQKGTHDGRRDSLSKTRQLLEPFLKVEQCGQKYRPQHKELPTWPHLNISTPAGTCPFDGVGVSVDKRSKAVSKEAAASAGHAISHGTQSTTQRRSLEADDLVGTPILTAGDLRRQKEKLKQEQRRRGYCECCHARYDDIEKHLKEPTHAKFARDKNNYEILENLIGRLPSASQFLRNTLLRHCSGHQADKLFTSASGLQASDEDSSIDQVLTISASTPTKPPSQVCDAAPAPEMRGEAGFHTPTHTPQYPTGKGVSGSFTHHQQPADGGEQHISQAEVSQDCDAKSKNKDQSKRLPAVVVRRPGVRGVYGSPRDKRSSQGRSPYYQDSPQTPKKVRERSMVFGNTSIGSLQSVNEDPNLMCGSQEDIERPDGEHGDDESEVHGSPDRSKGLRDAIFRRQREQTPQPSTSGACYKQSPQPSTSGTSFKHSLQPSTSQTSEHSPQPSTSGISNKPLASSPTISQSAEVKSPAEKCAERGRSQKALQRGSSLKRKRGATAGVNMSPVHSSQPAQEREGTEVGGQVEKHGGVDLETDRKRKRRSSSKSGSASGSKRLPSPQVAELQKASLAVENMEIERECEGNENPEGKESKDSAVESGVRQLGDTENAGSGDAGFLPVSQSPAEASQTATSRESGRVQSGGDHDKPDDSLHAEEVETVQIREHCTPQKAFAQVTEEEERAYSPVYSPVYFTTSTPAVLPARKLRSTKSGFLTSPKKDEGSPVKSCRRSLLTNDGEPEPSATTPTHTEPSASAGKKTSSAKDKQHRSPRKSEHSASESRDSSSRRREDSSSGKKETPVSRKGGLKSEEKSAVGSEEQASSQSKKPRREERSGPNEERKSRKRQQSNPSEERSFSESEEESEEQSRKSGSGKKEGSASKDSCVTEACRNSAQASGSNLSGQSAENAQIPASPTPSLRIKLVRCSQPVQTSTKKVKLSRSWQLLSDSSMSRLLKSDTEVSSFDGFQGDEALPSDLTYVSASEVEVTDDEDREWLFEDEEPVNLRGEMQGGELIRDFIPTFSSPGKSNSSWDDACDLYVSQSVQQQLKSRQPRRSPRKASASQAKKRKCSARGHGKTEGNVTKKRKLKKVEDDWNPHHRMHTPTKRDRKNGLLCDPDTLSVDKEIPLGCVSPRKHSASLPLSPLKNWNGEFREALLHSPKQSHSKYLAAGLPPPFKIQ